MARAALYKSISPSGMDVAHLHGAGPRGSCAARVPRRSYIEEARERGYTRPFVCGVGPRGSCAGPLRVQEAALFARRWSTWVHSAGDVGHVCGRGHAGPARVLRVPRGSLAGPIEEARERAVHGPLCVRRGSTRVLRGSLAGSHGSLRGLAGHVANLWAPQVPRRSLAIEEAREGV